MNKQKFYNYLASKYNLPVKYVAFKLNPYYIYKAGVELGSEQMEAIENNFNWDYIAEDYIRDCNKPASIFYKSNN